MKNKVGQDAFITDGIMDANLGKRVQVVGYIGFLEAESILEYNGMHMRVPITDNYFWIFCPAGLETPLGETSKAYAPDSWLRPIKPDDGVKAKDKALETS